MTSYFAVSGFASVSAETVIVRNVHGITPLHQKGLQEFSVMIIQDGRVVQIEKTEKIRLA